MTRDVPPGSPTALVVVMGVAGAGKTTIGRALAISLAVPFCDGDDLHPPANVTRMRDGLPLRDADREPWLDAVHAVLARARDEAHGLVVACSALRRSYRQRIAVGLPQLAFVHLQAPRAVLEARLQQRRGHFFPAALLDSQLATLEALGPGEGASIDATMPVERVVTAIRAALRGSGPSANNP